MKIWHYPNPVSVQPSFLETIHSGVIFPHHFPIFTSHLLHKYVLIHNAVLASSLIFLLIYIWYLSGVLQPPDWHYSSHPLSAMIIILDTHHLWPHDIYNSLCYPDSFQIQHYPETVGGHEQGRSGIISREQLLNIVSQQLVSIVENSRNMPSKENFWAWPAPLLLAPHFTTWRSVPLGRCTEA